MYINLVTHIHTCHATHVNESCHTCEYQLYKKNARAIKLIRNASNLFLVYFVTHIFIHSFICVQHDWIIIHVHQSCHTHSYKSQMHKWCNTHKWGMSHLWLSHITRVNESCHTCKRDMSHMRISVQKRNVRAMKLIRDASSLFLVYFFFWEGGVHFVFQFSIGQMSIGWQRFIGFLNLWVSFAKESYQNWALLRKSTIRGISQSVGLFRKRALPNPVNLCKMWQQFVVSLKL